MSQGALSLALLLGGVNAACAPAPAAPAALAPEPSPAPRPSRSGAPRPGRRYTGPVVIAGETIYAGSVDRKVYAVDLASGQMRWSSPAGRAHRRRRARARGHRLRGQRPPRRQGLRTRRRDGPPTVADDDRDRQRAARAGRRARWWPRPSAARSSGSTRPREPSVAAAGRVRPHCGGRGRQRDPDRGHHRFAFPPERARWQDRRRASVAGHHRVAVAAPSWTAGGGHDRFGSGGDRPGDLRPRWRCHARRARARHARPHGRHALRREPPRHHLSHRPRLGAGGGADRGARLAGDGPRHACSTAFSSWAAPTERSARSDPTAARPGACALAARSSSAPCRWPTACLPSAATATFTGTADDPRSPARSCCCSRRPRPAAGPGGRPADQATGNGCWRRARSG